MSYHRGRENRWYNNTNWPWTSQYGKYTHGKDSWPRECSGYNRDSERYNRYNNWPRNRGNYSSYSSLSDQRYHKINYKNNNIANIINIEAESKPKPKASEESINQVTSEKVSENVQETPNTFKNDEQLVTSSNTIHSPVHVLSSDDEKSVRNQETLPVTRTAITNKLVSDLLRKRTPKQLNDILTNPDQSRKYKAAFDALKKEKRLSMHNELHQKYPRQHPPSGNSALINPADSVDLYQLPPHFVEGILGLGLELQDEVDVRSVLPVESKNISEICFTSVNLDNSLEIIDQANRSHLSEQIIKLSPAKLKIRLNSNISDMNSNMKDKKNLKQYVENKSTCTVDEVHNKISMDEQADANVTDAISNSKTSYGDTSETNYNKHSPNIKVSDINISYECDPHIDNQISFKNNTKIEKHYDALCIYDTSTKIDNETFILNDTEISSNVCEISNTITEPNCPDEACSIDNTQSYEGLSQKTVILPANHYLNKSVGNFEKLSGCRNANDISSVECNVIDNSEQNANKCKFDKDDLISQKSKALEVIAKSSELNKMENEIISNNNEMQAAFNDITQKARDFSDDFDGRRKQGFVAENNINHTFQKGYRTMSSFIDHASLSSCITSESSLAILREIFKLDKKILEMQLEKMKLIDAYLETTQNVSGHVDELSDSIHQERDNSSSNKGTCLQTSLQILPSHISLNGNGDDIFGSNNEVSKNDEANDDRIKKNIAHMKTAIDKSAIKTAFCGELLKTSVKKKTKIMKKSSTSKISDVPTEMFPITEELKTGKSKKYRSKDKVTSKHKSSFSKKIFGSKIYGTVLTHKDATSVVDTCESKKSDKLNLVDKPESTKHRKEIKKEHVNKLSVNSVASLSKTLDNCNGLKKMLVSDHGSYKQNLLERNMCKESCSCENHTNRKEDAIINRKRRYSERKHESCKKIDNEFNMKKKKSGAENLAHRTLNSVSDNICSKKVDLVDINFSAKNKLSHIDKGALEVMELSHKCVPISGKVHLMQSTIDESKIVAQKENETVDNSVENFFAKVDCMELSNNLSESNKKCEMTYLRSNISEKPTKSKELISAKRSPRKLHKSINAENPLRELRAGEETIFENMQQRENEKLQCKTDHSTLGILQCNVVLRRLDMSVLPDSVTSGLKKNKTSHSIVGNSCKFQLCEKTTPKYILQNNDEICTKSCNNELRNDENSEHQIVKISFTDHKEPIVDLCELNHIVYAASEDGCVYAYNTRDALFMYCMRKHYGAITHADILGKVLYTVGLDARLQRCIEIDQKPDSTREINMEFLANLSGPAQTFCISWNRIYVGTRNGIMDVYDISKKKVVDAFNIGGSSVLSIACTREGPRKVT